MTRRSSRAQRTLLTATLVAMIGLGGWLIFRARSPAPIPRKALAYTTAHDRVAPALAFRRQATQAPPAPSEAAPPQTELDRALGPPRWRTRPAGEWDGMLVNLNVSPPCERPDGCGMARACKDGKCVACDVDVDCAPAEVCALDHCVRRENVSCRRRADCPPENNCVLSGYSSGIRGNEHMRAYCLALKSGAGQLPPAPEKPPAKDSRTSLPDDDLLKAASDARPR